MNVQMLHFVIGVINRISKIGKYSNKLSLWFFIDVHQRLNVLMKIKEIMELINV